MTGRHQVLAAALIPAAVPFAAAEDPVRRLDRRSGAPALMVSDPAATIDGLRVEIADETLERTDLVPWDRIARLEPPEGGELERRIRAGIEVGTLVWRGRERLRRGDGPLAAAAFEEAADRLETDGFLGGLLDRSVLEGRLRAELSTGRSGRVLGEAILVGERFEDQGGPYEGAAFGPAVVDARTRLVPAVPPIGDAQAIARCEATLALRPSTEVGEQRRRRLWRRVLGADGTPLEVPRPPSEDEGAILLWNLARLDAPDPGARESTRAALLRSIETRPAWIRNWIHFFTGRASIDHAAGDEDLLRGVLDLLHVIADDASVSPSLRLRAIEIVADTLELLDRSAEATVFESLSPRRSDRRPNPEPPS